MQIMNMVYDSTQKQATVNIAEPTGKPYISMIIAFSADPNMTQAQLEVALKAEAKHVLHQAAGIC